MNLDSLVYYVLLPCVKYPFFFLAFYGQHSLSTYAMLILYSIALHVFLAINNWFKRDGNKKWFKLNEIEKLKVLITGGSNGLGESLISELLLKVPDITIVNVDVTPSKFNDKRVHDYLCDLGDSAQLDETIEALKEQFQNTHPFHVIVNNAGIRSKYGSITTVNDKEYKRLFEVNTFAPIKITQSFAPLTESNRHQCYVVNIASTLGILGPSKVAPYASSKAALIAFHESFKYELKSHNISSIRTLLVVVGQMNTRLFDGFEPPRQFFAPVIDTTALSKKILRKCQLGERGQINEPFYSNFAHLLMSLPFCFQCIIRKISGMDDCLPEE